MNRMMALALLAAVAGCMPEASEPDDTDAVESEELVLNPYGGDCNESCGQIGRWSTSNLLSWLDSTVPRLRNTSGIQLETLYLANGLETVPSVDNDALAGLVPWNSGSLKADVDVSSSMGTWYRGVALRGARLVLSVANSRDDGAVITRFCLDVVAIGQHQIDPLPARATTTYSLRIHKEDGSAAESLCPGQAAVFSKIDHSQDYQIRCVAAPTPYPPGSI